MPECNSCEKVETGVQISAGPELIINMKQKSSIKTFGLLKDLRKRKKKSTEEILREIDKEFWGRE